MPKFTKKPVTIEAMQFDGTVESADAIREWATMPDGMSAECARDSHKGACTYLGIRTLEGTMRANSGDWIIKGVKGEFYPCKPDIFAATYEDAAIALMRGQSEAAGFYIATFKHKDNGGAVTWWGPNDAGYTPDLATAGVYTELTAGYHENEYTVPVPVSFIKGLRVRRTVDPGDSLNRAFWSANHLREAIAATYAPPKDTADEQ